MYGYIEKKNMIFLNEDNTYSHAVLVLLASCMHVILAPILSFCPPSIRAVKNIWATIKIAILFPIRCNITLKVSNDKEHAYTSGNHFHIIYTPCYIEKLGYAGVYLFLAHLSR